MLNIKFSDFTHNPKFGFQIDILINTKISLLLHFEDWVISNSIFMLTSSRANTVQSTRKQKAYLSKISSYQIEIEIKFKIEIKLKQTPPVKAKNFIFFRLKLKYKAKIMLDAILMMTFHSIIHSIVQKKYSVKEFIHSIKT